VDTGFVVWHTGDFRVDYDLLNKVWKKKAPPRGADQRGIDLMYLDNTYNEPGMKLPHRSDALASILSLHRRGLAAAREWQDPAAPGADKPTSSTLLTVLGIDNLGKEELLLALLRAHPSPRARCLVTPQRLRWLRLCGLTPGDLARFTSVDDGQAEFKVVPRRSLSRKRVLLWNETRPTLTIMCSAWVDDEREDGPRKDQLSILTTLHQVPYSLHSPPVELHDFVAAMRPRSILPIIKNLRSDMSSFHRHCSTSVQVVLHEVATMVSARDADNRDDKEHTASMTTAGRGAAGGAEDAKGAESAVSLASRLHKAKYLIPSAPMMAVRTRKFGEILPGSDDDSVPDEDQHWADNEEYLDLVNALEAVEDEEEQAGEGEEGRGSDSDSDDDAQALRSS
jgi:hypothetical protein